MNVNGQIRQQNNTMSSTGSIDTMAFLNVLWRNILVIILTALICGGAAFGYSYLFTKAEYTSSVLVYINKSGVSIGGTDVVLSSSESVNETYTTILKSRTTLEEIAQTSETGYTWQQLYSMISVSSESGKSFMNISVTCNNPIDCEKIANTIADVLPIRVADIVNGSTLRVVDYAIVPSSRTTSGLTTSFLIGALVGAAVVCGILFLKFYIDSNHAPLISSASSLTEGYPEYPLLGVIGDLTYSDKKYSNGVFGYGKYTEYYTAGEGNGKTTKDNKVEAKSSADTKKKDKNGPEKLICENVSNASREEYKRIRTNLRFCLDSSKKCPVIGITSAQPADGKSVTSINIAYSLAQLQDKKVLLIDCDMRRPSINTKLELPQAPGLSNVLSNVNVKGKFLHTYMPEDGSCSFDVITSGTLPPNPSELLSDSKLRALLSRLMDSYDYIVLDLPPIGAVSDAQVVSEVADGLMVVIREGYCTKPLLDECLNQMRLANARVLGFILNGSVETTKSSYKYKKYYKTENYYGNGYDRHATTDK